MPHSKLIVVPGFLSEKPSYGHALPTNIDFDKIDPLKMFDARGWQILIEHFVQEQQLLLDVEVFVWPSHSIFNLLFDQLKVLQNHWKSLVNIKDISKSFLIQGAQQIHDIWSFST